MIYGMDSHNKVFLFPTKAKVKDYCLYCKIYTNLFGRLYSWQTKTDFMEMLRKYKKNKDRHILLDKIDGIVYVNIARQNIINHVQYTL